MKQSELHSEPFLLAVLPEIHRDHNQLTGASWVTMSVSDDSFLFLHK